MTTRRNGQAVDREGHTAADPSLNVGALVESEGRHQKEMREADSRRQDDLRQAAKELAEVNDTHSKELAALNVVHSKEMAAKESGRVDSLRQGDREETTRTAVAANTAITVLAKQTTDLATTLDKKMTDSSSIADQRNSSANTDLSKRLGALELSSSEGKGKQQVADPALERLATLVENLARAQQTGDGVKRGTSDGVKLVIAILTVLSLYLGLATFSSKPAQVIYAPAPPGALLPSTPPQQVPR